MENIKVWDTVTYMPKKEVGVVTSMNDSFVFVRYGTDTTSKATRREDLEKGDQSFYCPNEHNSILAGAFGRCATICRNCLYEEKFVKDNL